MLKAMVHKLKWQIWVTLFFWYFISWCKRRSGLMVRVLDSGSSGPGSSPGWVIVLCSNRQDTLLSQCFSSPRCTNGYQQLCWGVTLQWTSIPSRGCSNTPSCFMLRKPELSASPMGHLGLYKRWPHGPLGPVLIGALLFTSWYF